MECQKAKIGKLVNISKEMKRMNIELLGLSETFWKYNKEFHTSLPTGKEYKIVTSGEGSHRKGVGFIIRKNYAHLLKMSGEFLTE